MSMVLLSPKQQGETANYNFDFISRLGVNETITTQSVTATVWSGNDPSPSSIISGAATASRTVVTQKITGGVVGTIYKLVCQVTTSSSQTLQLVGYLPILINPI